MLNTFTTMGIEHGLFCNLLIFNSKFLAAMLNTPLIECIEHTPEMIHRAMTVADFVFRTGFYGIGNIDLPPSHSIIQALSLSQI